MIYTAWYKIAPFISADIPASFFKINIKDVSLIRLFQN